MKDLNYLLPSTKETLFKLSEYEIFNDFTFVGGSALSIFLQHRLSEDLDFFTWKPQLELDAIHYLLSNCFGNDFQIIRNSSTQFDAIANKTKITFFANKWEHLKNSDSLINKINIAPLDLLTAMKINTLFIRAKFRDYYDLYSLNKNVFSIDKMYNIASQYIPGISTKLFHIALIFVDDIEEDEIKHFSPIYKITKKQIAKHFEKEVKQWIKLKAKI